ncbi:MAG TPA: MATE family efflux transporter [bacterium]|nr:MATE family efflux transporter [bacterium]
MKTPGKQDLTQGGIAGYIFRLSIPVMLGMGLQNMYTIVDLYWVGRLGDTAIAAITLAGTLFFFFFAIAQTVGAGALAIVSRAYGQKQKQQAVHTVRNAVFAGIIMGIIVGGSCFVFARYILIGLRARGDVITLGALYLRPIGIAFGFQIISFVINFSMRGAGDMRTPLIAMIISTFTNMLLDPLLIFGWWIFPELGISGAGIATLIATAISAAYVFVILVTGRSILHVPIITRFKPDWPLINQLVRIGLPAGLQFLFLSLSFMIIIILVAAYGEAPVTAAGTAWRLIHLSTIPVIGIAAAVATLVGQNLGAGKPERADSACKIGIAGACFCASIIAVTFAALPDFFMKIFVNSDEVVALGRTILRILAFNEVLLGLNIVFNNAFSGAGDNMPPMFGAIVRSVIQIIVAFSLLNVPSVGMNGIWISIPVSTLFNTMFLGLIYRKGHWKTRMLRREEEMNNKPLKKDANNNAVNP